MTEKITVVLYKYNVDIVAVVSCRIRFNKESRAEVILKSKKNCLLLLAYLQMEKILSIHSDVRHEMKQQFLTFPLNSPKSYVSS